MGLFVNTNVRSLNTQRALNYSTKRLDRSFERLSSGKRINAAKDDAAGLTISSRFTAQIRGLNMAMRNTNDGISLSQTVEGALQETMSILQRMRELSVQAANDINTDSDREAINREIGDLVQELDRIAETTRFNNKQVLNGDFMQGYFHIGHNSDETVQVNIRDARTRSLGRSAIKQTTTVGTQALDKNGGDVIINGITIRSTADVDDENSTSFASGSAISKVAAINDSSRYTGVRARALETVAEAQGDIQGGVLDSESYIAINGEILTTFTVHRDDADKEMIDQINAVADKTGVVAYLNERSQLALKASDGRNIEVFVSDNNAATVTGLQSGVFTAGIEFSSPDQFRVEGDELGAIGLADPVVVGVDALQSINKVKVLSRAQANHAITIIDRALEQVSNDRSYLGALQNRLEATVRNLGSSVESISRARSRILDADFAVESAAMARDQVLQQAGVSILAQANQAPNLALSLLQ